MRRWADGVRPQARLRRQLIRAVAASESATAGRDYDPNKEKYAVLLCMPLSAARTQPLIS